jgi:hypothetical protein
MLAHLRPGRGAGRSRRRGGHAAVDMGGRAVGGGRLVVVPAGTRRPHAGPARHQGQGERAPGHAQPSRRRAGPGASGLVRQDGQGAGQSGRHQGDPDPGEHVARVGKREHALGGGQPRVARVQHGVPGQPDHEQDQSAGASEDRPQQAGGQ